MGVDSAQIADVFREAHGQVFGRLVGLFGDFDVAADAVQDAFVAALVAWPTDGVPRRPAAWITTVARNAAINSKRHEAVIARKQQELIARADDDRFADDTFGDDRLRLLFTCCHPALAEPARVALTLRTVCGLSTPEIARLFLVPEPTVAQRMVRAKQKIKEAGIPFAIPEAEDLSDRIDGVLACIYLMFTEGYAPSAGTLVVRAPLCDEAIRLARATCHAFPTHAEAHGLLGLMLLHHARRHARSRPDGHPVALEDQDRAAWDRSAIGEGIEQLDEALRLGGRGPYAIQAAIAALHAAAANASDTDWSQIAGLYAELMRRVPSPVVGVALAIAEGMADGPQRGLACLDALVDRAAIPRDFDRLPAARADLLARAGRHEQARAAYREAIERARYPRQAQFLRGRADRLG